eukprot:m.166466 g.166466  ORF g.166466 m.166466 type:complete len:204 (-) comp18160_c1_seq16:43-654(-)
MILLRSEHCRCRLLIWYVSEPDNGPAQYAGDDAYLPLDAEDVNMGEPVQFQTLNTSQLAPTTVAPSQRRPRRSMPKSSVQRGNKPSARVVVAEHYVPPSSDLPRVTSAGDGMMTTQPLPYQTMRPQEHHVTMKLPHVHATPMQFPTYKRHVLIALCRQAIFRLESIGTNGNGSGVVRHVLVFIGGLHVFFVLSALATVASASR